MSTTQPDESGLRRYGIFVIVAAASLFIMWFGQDYFEQSLLKPQEAAANLHVGTMLPTPKPLLPINLIDQDSKPFTLDNLKGHWTFLVIGYTSCPDVCPTLMAAFKVMDKLINQTTNKPAQPAKPIADFVFVSVDPERDSPKHIGEYVRYFNPRFIGATSNNHQNLNALTSQLGLIYHKANDQTSAMGYMIDHSASIILIDPNAAWKAIFSPPHDPQAIADDFSIIQAGYKTSISDK